jgi:hypothetical protein
MTRISVYAWDYAAELTLKQGGGTFNGEGFVSKPDNGYIVGGVVPSEIIQMGGILTARSLAERLAHFRAKHGVHFSNRTACYVGTWKDGADNIHLDVSEWVPTFKQAIALAVYRKEAAIWDVAAGKEVSTLPAHIGIEEAYAIAGK